MAVQTSAGSTLSIATGTPATNDGPGFLALTYVGVSEITDLGTVGKTFATVTFMPIGSRGVQKFKGSFQNGTIQLKMGRDSASTGQIAMKAALASDAVYSFKITLQDLSKLYFTGRVTAMTTAVGTVDQITGLDATIELQSDSIIEA